MIESRVNAQKLILNADNKNFSNCSYSVRIGKIFVPNSGDEYDFNKHTCYKLKPSEVALIETVESVVMPSDCYGLYTPLQSRANEGVMLINGSLIEPAYEGKLSSYIVNVSSKEIVLTKNSKIAKITFIKVDPSFNNPNAIKISDSEYSQKVSINAAGFDTSFVNLDIKSEKITSRLRKELYVGVGFIVLIALFTTVKGFFSNTLDVQKDILNSELDKKVKMLIESNEKTLSDIRAQLAEMKNTAPKDSKK